MGLRFYKKKYLELFRLGQKERECAWHKALPQMQK
jgi:hypothetical protein